MGILRDATLHFINQCFPTLFQRLHVSLSRGHVDSTDVVISQSDPISVCSIPLQIIDGTVSGLSLQFPWMNPRTAKFSVRVKSVHIHLAEVPFPNSQDLVFRAMSDEILRSKFRNVAEAERNQARFGSSIRNFLSQVLERIELLVQDFTLVIEFADGSVGTLTIAKLRARRSGTEELPPDASPTFLVTIEGVSAIICNSANESELPVSIPEFSATVRIELGEQNLEADLDISKIVQVFIDSSLREWLQLLRLRQRKWILAHKCDRPRCSPQEDGPAWIRYAFRRVSTHRGLRRVRFDVDNVRRTFGRFAEYKSLHVKRLHKLRLNPEEINRIAILEGRFDAEMILLLRQAGKREVDADEISQFGTSEWLRWILFGHNISYEREKLAADLTQSLEASTDNRACEKADSEGSIQSQVADQRYAFHFRLSGLATYMCNRDHDMNITLTGLSFSIETNSGVGQFSAKLSLRDLVCSADGDIAVQKKRESAKRAHTTGEGTLLDASLCSMSNEMSILVNLHSLLVVLHPGILSSCVATFQRWMTTLPSPGYDLHEEQIRCSSRNLQSPFVNFVVQNITFSADGIYVFVFDDSSNHDSKNSEIIAVLRQLEIRSVPRIASFTPELAVSLSLQLSQFNASSAVTDFLKRTAEFSLEEPGQEVLSFSTNFGFHWTPVLTVDFTRADGFVDIPTMARLSCGLYLSIVSQIMAVVPKQDDHDVCRVSESDSEFSGSQKHLTQSVLQLRVSSLNVNMKWGEALPRDIFTLDFRQLEICLSPTGFSLVSLRIESIHLSSGGVVPTLLQIEPTAGFQHALRLKRDCRSSPQDDFYEVLSGDISGRLSPDAILAVVDLVLEMMSALQRAPRTAPETGTSQPDERDSETLLSLFAASLRIKWFDAPFEGEISCFDIQATAEASKISGSIESITLIEVDASNEITSTDGIIVRVNDDLRKGNAPVRFLHEPSGSHIRLSNLMGSARRSFWEPLVLSIAGVCDKIEAQLRQFYQENSNLGLSQAASEPMAVTIEGSEVTVSLPHAASNTDSLVCADIHHVVVCLRPDLQRISLRRISVFLKNSCPRSDGKGARILSTADCEIIHKTKLLDNDPETSSRVSEVWEFDALSEFAIALSPKSISALRNAIQSLITPVQWAEPSSKRTASTDLVQDTAVAKRFQFLFRCSIPLLRVALGTKGVDPSFNPFVTVLAEGLSLSIADVRVGNSGRGFDVMVLTLLASVRTLSLSKNRRSSPDSLRVVIRGEYSRYPPQNLASPLCKGVSVRLLSRKDHGEHATKYEVSVNNVSAMHDPEMYENIAQFMTECLCLMSASAEDTPCGYRQDEGEKAEYPYGAKQEKSESQGRRHDFAPSTTYSEQRLPPSGSPFAKVAIVISNFTFLCSMNHFRDSTLIAFLHVHKASGALVMSNVTRQEIKSTLRLDGISCFVEDSVPDFRGKDASVRHRTSQELSGHDMNYMHVPMLLSPSIVVRAMSHSAQKLTINAGFISTTYSNSLRNELVVSIGNVSAKTSVESLIHLTEVLSSLNLFFSGQSGTPSNNRVAEQLALRLHVQNASAKLGLNTLPVTDCKKAAINAVIRVSVKYVSDDFFKTSEGFVKVSLEVTDNSTGHCDTLISPCKISFRIGMLQDWNVETKIEHLLRMSFSPVTVRMFSALNDALHECTFVRAAPDTSQSFLGKKSRLRIQVHGIAIRCLSDTPRIQILRLLLGEVFFEVVLNESLESRLMQFRIRDYVLEDTISWRLFRDDEKDSTSRRWERIVSSVRRPGHRPVTPHKGPTQVLQGREPCLDSVVPSVPPRDTLLHSALHCQFSWRGGFEDFKGLLSLSDVYLNLDLAAVPIIGEWYNSLLREFPTAEGSRSWSENGQVGELAPPTQRRPWFSELHIEPFTITGSIRATPRRLQQSILERVLTGIWDVEAVTGISLHLPSVCFRGEQARLTTVFHKIFAEYSHSALSRHFLSGILTQSGKLTRLARMLFLSFFRRRPYNPLRLSTDKLSTESRSQSATGLLGVLDSTEKENHLSVESLRFTRPLVLHRVNWTRGFGVLGLEGLHDSLMNVLDLT